MAEIIAGGGEAGNTRARRVDVSALLDEQQPRLTHFAAITLCFLVMFVDGYDLFVISMAIPSIARDLGVAPSAAAPVIALQNVGLAIGACLAGPLSDRFGRKLTLIVTVLGFSVMTVASTYAADLMQLAWLRLLTGMFLAGAAPNTAPLISELTPKRNRAGFVGLMFSGTAAGAIAAGIANAALLPDHGWRFVFLTAALAGLALAPLLWALLPESPRFLLRKNPNDPRLLRIVRQLAPTANITASDIFEDREGARAGERAGSVKALFSGQRWRVTSLLWIAFMLNLLSATSFAAWTPSVLEVAGELPITTIATVMVIIGIGGFFGSVASGFVLDRLGAKRGLLLWFIASMAFWAVLGTLDLRSSLGLGAAFMAGVAMVGSQSALAAYIPSIYPTRIRATGVGWAYSSGRIASIVAPLLYAGLVSSEGSVSLYFLALAAPLAFVVALIPFLTDASKAAAEDEAKANRENSDAAIEVEPASGDARLSARITEGPLR